MNNTIKATSINRIKGMKTTKYQCFVLCLKTYIPRVVPNAPPIKATKNKLASLILHAPRLARDLSIPIKENPTMEEIKK